MDYNKNIDKYVDWIESLRNLSDTTWEDNLVNIERVKIGKTKYTVFFTNDSALKVVTDVITNESKLTTYYLKDNKLVLAKTLDSAYYYRNDTLLPFSNLNGLYEERLSNAPLPSMAYLTIDRWKNGTEKVYMK